MSGHGAARALRELADILDVVPGLPEPFTVTAQASAGDWGQTQWQRFARVHDVAEQLGVAVWTDWRGGRAARYRIAACTYLVYANPDHLVAAAPVYSREREHTWVVTRAQDEAAATTDPKVRAALEAARRLELAEAYSVQLDGALHARGLELSAATLTTVTLGES